MERKSSTESEDRERLEDRHKLQAAPLAEFTGWDMATIREKMGADAPKGSQGKWYDQLWKE